MRKKILLWAGMLCVALLPALASAAAGPAGTVTMVTGKGTASNPASGDVRVLNKGDVVYSGEVISSGANSYVNLKFSDGGLILLRPGTRFQIEAFSDPAPVEPVAPAPAPSASPAPATPAPPPAAAAPAPQQRSGTSRAFFRLLRGGFRAVSGLIGKANNADYRVNTPVATIGIRGTDYEAFLCDRACQADPAIRDALEQLSNASLKPSLKAAAFRKASHRAGRLVKVASANDPGVVQVTYTYSGEVVVDPPNGPAANVPAGTGVVTTQKGSSAPLGGPTPTMKANPTPNPVSCQ